MCSDFQCYQSALEQAEVLWKVPLEQSEPQRRRFMLLSAVNASYYAFQMISRSKPAKKSFADSAFYMFVQLSNNVEIQFITVMCL